VKISAVNEGQQAPKTLDALLIDKDQSHALQSKLRKRESVIIEINR
jgi:hypothetical protein